MNYIITKTPEFFKNIGSYNFCSLKDMVLPNTIAIDTETTGLTPLNCDIFCTQIGTGKNNYLIHMYDDNYTFEDLIPYIEDKVLVGQNILFDLGFFYKHNFYPKEVKDTMLASKILHNGDYGFIRNDFGTLMERELNIIYDKTSQKNINVVKLSVPSAIKYSFNDVDKLLKLHDVLEAQIIENKYKETYDLHCKFIRALAYMEQCGLPINSKMWKAKMKEDKDNSILYEKKIENYIFDNVSKFADRQIDMFSDEKRIIIKISSPKQMIEVFKELGINTKDKDDKDSIQENVISKTKHEFVDLWLDYQKANHRVTTFGKSIYDKIIDGRVYTNFNPMVETARLSSRKGGINFLNFPSDKKTRECFEAKPGNKMIVCDYSAQEGVIMADLSGDAAMTSSVVDGVDLHCLLAKAVYPQLEGLSDEEIATEHKSKRSFVKPIRFAFSYGGNGYTIYQNLGVPLAEAEIIYSKFRDLHAGLYEWGDKMFEKAVRKGYIESADGWKLHLPKFDLFLEYQKTVSDITPDQWTLYREGKQERNREYMLKEKHPDKPFKVVNKVAYEFYKSKRKQISNYFSIRSTYQRLCLNNPVQARAAHQLKTAILLYFEWILEKGYVNKVKICNAVHDEMVIECPEELAEESKLALEKAMLDGGHKYLKKLNIKADAEIGQSWAEAK